MTAISTNKKVGVALGCGGWRGLAHIGVLKSLEKHGVRIDYIAGSSVGALVGGLYAFYGGISELEKIVDSIGYRDLARSLSDPTVKLGLLKGGRLVEFLEKHLQGAKIEDLKVPYKAVATDIITGESIFIDKGSLSKAIRASISIPIMLAPVPIENRKLVDGGVSMPVPTKVVREMGADIVIGVNLYGNIFPMTEALDNNAIRLSAREIFRLSYQMLLNKLATENLEEADIALNPKIKEGSFNIFKNFVREKGTVKCGEEAMDEAIVDLKKLLEG